MATKLTEKQAAALDQFREMMKDTELPERDDSYLLTWLVAREFDCAKAEKMLRASLEWRRQNRVDELNENWQGPEVLRKYFAGGFAGVDKFGCPICIGLAGRTDMRGLLASVRPKEYLQYGIWLSEIATLEMKRSSQRLGRPITQQVTIVDLEGFSMSFVTHAPTMNISRQLFEINEANYPENLRKAFVINAPKMFTVAYALFRPFMSDATASKFVFFGTNDKEWKAALLEEIDADQLPVRYGGTMTDPDGNPDCITRICMGGKVPKSYYLVNNPPKAKENYKSLVVAHGAAAKLEFDVEGPGHELRWEFFCEDKDIAYTVYRKDENASHEIVPRERVDCSTALEEGQIVCSIPGTYVLEFDNSYSYLRSKKIHYLIGVSSQSS